MTAKLSSITKDLFDRELMDKRITALTGGLSNIDAIVITAGGTGYVSVPTVVFTGGGGAGAAGTAVLVAGVVTAVTITNKGSGYTSTPAVSFTPVSGGSGAAGSAVMAPTTLDAIPTTDKTVGEYLAMFVLSSALKVYELKAGTTAESSPTIIRPDDYNGSTNQKYWSLVTLSAGGSTNGIVSISSGVDQFSITGLGLSTSPTQVVVTVLIPSGGQIIMAVVLDGTLDTDGFDVVLTNVTPATGYKLAYAIS